MRKRIVKGISMALIAALTVGLAACGAQQEAPKPASQVSVEQSYNDTQETNVSVANAHNFSQGVCTDCGINWTEALYDAGVAKFGGHSDGNCYFSIQVDDGNVSFSIDKRTFYIEYETDIVDDERTTYTFRTYVDDAGVTIYKDDKIEYTYHDSNAEPDANAPVSDLNIDYAIERHFDEAGDYGEYTYLTSYECPANKLIDMYKSKEILTGERAYALLWYKNFEEDYGYTDSDFEKGDITMEDIFGSNDYMTKDDFYDRYMNDYDRCLKGMNQALNQLGFDLAGYGIAY